MSISFHLYNSYTTDFPCKINDIHTLPIVVGTVTADDMSMQRNGGIKIQGIDSPLRMSKASHYVLYLNLYTFWFINIAENYLSSNTRTYLLFLFPAKTKSADDHRQRTRATASLAQLSVSEQSQHHAIIANVKE